MVLVFVYGTLKTGLPNHFLLKNSENGKASLVKKGKTRNKFPLIVATPFGIPFLLNKPGSGQKIEGEVYEVDEKMLVVLDELERNGELYTRTPIEVESMEDQIPPSSITCDVYLINDFLESLLDYPFFSSYTDASTYVSPQEKQRTLKEVQACIKKPKSA